MIKPKNKQNLTIFSLIAPSQHKPKAQKWKEIASRAREHGFFIFELKKSRKSIFRVQRSIYMTNPYMHLKAHEILDMGEVLNTNLMTEK